MVEISISRAVGRELEALGIGIHQLERVMTDSGPVLIALSGVSGGLVAIRFDDAGHAYVADTLFLEGIFGAAFGRGFSVLSTPKGPFLALVGLGDDSLSGYYFHGSQFGPQGQLAVPGMTAATSHLCAQSQDQTIFTVGIDGVLRAYVPADDTTYRLSSAFHEMGSLLGGVLSKLETISVDGQVFVVATALGQPRISLVRVDSSTHAMQSATMTDPESGLGILEHVVSLDAVTVAGRSYLIVGSQSDASAGGGLTVLEVFADGSTRAVDHILDNLESRFGNLTSVAVLSHDEWTYIAACGGDLGLSLFALAPGGEAFAS